MKHVVTVEESAFPETFRSLRLAGPETGLDSALILCSRVPPGHKGPRLHTHPVDQFYFILEGHTNVQIGTDIFQVGPDTLVHFPAGTPHCNWNDSSDYEMHLEIMVPAPPTEGLMNYEVEARKVPNADQFIYRLDPNGYLDRAFATQQMASRATGSEHALIYAAKVQPGSGGPPLHFHQFDQLYFILEGSFDVEIGLSKMRAPSRSLVVLPKGVLHTNRNNASTPECHLAILLPEPAPGEQFDYRVEVQFDNERQPFSQSGKSLRGADSRVRNG